MIDRRSLIVTGAAAAATVLAGAQAAQAEPELVKAETHNPLDHPLMQNVIRELNHRSQAIGRTPFDEVLLAVNLALISKHNDELFADPRRYMTSPVITADDGTVVTAKTRKFNARWTFQPISDRPPEQACVSEVEIIRDLVEQFHAELTTELNASPGTKFYPYIPVTSSGMVIDPITHELVTSFMTRYGTAT